MKSIARRAESAQRGSPNTRAAKAMPSIAKFARRQERFQRAMASEKSLARECSEQLATFGYQVSEAWFSDGYVIIETPVNA
jgi:hypothetical protein